jgi:hypothetical protein
MQAHNRGFMNRRLPGLDQAPASGRAEPLRRRMIVVARASKCEWLSGSHHCCRRHYRRRPQRLAEGLSDV